MVSTFALALSLMRPADAGVRRFALLVGNDEGGPSTEELYFAEADAQKIDRLLTTLGDVDRPDARVLLGKSRNEVLNVRTLRSDVNAAKGARRPDGRPVLLLGHADGEARARPHVGALRRARLLGRTGARRGSRSSTRAARAPCTREGGRSRLRRIESVGGARPRARIITSSSGDENSQESDEIGGSYFTHYLARRYPAQRTSITTTSSRSPRPTSTSTTRPCSARPSQAARSTDLRVGPRRRRRSPAHRSARGERRRSRSRARSRVATRCSTRRAAVRGRGRQVRGHRLQAHRHPGNYLVQQRYPTHLEVAEISLKDGGDERLDAERFNPVEYERDLAKGSIERQIKKAKAPKTSVHLLAGVLGSRDEEIQASYMPTVPVGGALVRWQWRDHRYIAADFQTVVTGQRSPSTTT
jgi:hypothetical protein